MVVILCVLGPAFYSGIAGGAKKTKKMSKGNAGKGQHMVCDVCNVTVTGRVMLDAHLAGNKMTFLVL